MIMLGGLSLAALSLHGGKTYRMRPFPKMPAMGLNLMGGHIRPLPLTKRQSNSFIRPHRMVIYS
jgi:hypothetical protein